MAAAAAAAPQPAAAAAAAVRSRRPVAAVEPLPRKESLPNMDPSGGHTAHARQQGITAPRTPRQSRAGEESGQYLSPDWRRRNRSRRM